MSINESLLVVAAVVVVAFFALRVFKTRRSADDQAERKATEEAARAEAERKAAEEAAQAETDTKAVEEALRLEEEERLAVEQAIARETVRQEAEEKARREAARKAAGEAQRLAATTAPVAAPAKAKKPEETVVMVADDSKVVRVKTGRLLGTQRYQVLMAEDGVDAARQIETALPDVLITDVDMPGMSGLQLTRQLRANAATAKLPIIMVTSDSEQLRAEADAAGVDVLLGKPYPEEQLVAHIQRLVNDRSGA